MPNIGPFRVYVLIFLGALLARAPIAHSALIEFQPESSSAATGESVSLDLLVSDLGDFGPDSLGAFDIFVDFDPSVLAFSSYNLGGLLGDIDLAEAIDASTGAAGGVVNVAEVSLLDPTDLDALQPGQFAVATLNFDVLDLAVGAVTQLSVLSGATLADAFGEKIDVYGLGSASITGVQSSVPEPGTLLLLFASLCGWLTLRKAGRV